jgi:hypothetical protein
MDTELYFYLPLVVTLLGLIVVLLSVIILQIYTESERCKSYEDKLEKEGLFLPGPDYVPQ